MNVTVVTPSVPIRAQLLAQASGSVRNQTVPCSHLVRIDHDRDGFAITTNTLVEQVNTDWVMILCDDDLLDPIHVATLLDEAADVDVVYSWCRVLGRGDWNPNAPFDREALLRANYIPGDAALIRTELWRKLGGYRDVTLEDWDFWCRAVDAGARFACVPKITWSYRFTEYGNLSLGTMQWPLTPSTS